MDGDCVTLAWLVDLRAAGRPTSVTARVDKLQSHCCLCFSVTHLKVIALVVFVTFPVHTLKPDIKIYKYVYTIWKQNLNCSPYNMESQNKIYRL